MYPRDRPKALCNSPAEHSPRLFAGRSRRDLSERLSMPVRPPVSPELELLRLQAWAARVAAPRPTPVKAAKDRLRSVLPDKLRVSRDGRVSSFRASWCSDRNPYST